MRYQDFVATMLSFCCHQNRPNHKATYTWLSVQGEFYVFSTLTCLNKLLQSLAEILFLVVMANCYA